MPMPKPIKAVLAPCRDELGDRCAHFRGHTHGFKALHQQ
jgi:hypothetical protein